VTDSTKLLKELWQEIGECKKCHNLESFDKPQFFGYSDAKILLIGQAPGKKEIEKGIPFAGAAGRNLFNWLRIAGLTEEGVRRKIYMSAVMRCYPGESKRGGDLKPNKLQLKNCEYFLRKEVEILKPKLVLLVGKLAIEHFLGNVRLDEVVGKSFKCKVFNFDTMVIPLPHPSGKSPWHFKPENRARITKAMHLLRVYKVSQKEDIK